MSDFFLTEVSNDAIRITATHDWVVDEGNRLSALIKEIVDNTPAASNIIIDAAQIEHFDTFGAVTLLHLEKKLKEKGAKVEIVNVTSKYTVLFNELQEGMKTKDVPKPAKEKSLDKAMLSLGSGVYNNYNDLMAMLDVFGETCMALWKTTKGESRFHFQALVWQLEKIAYQAVPIVMLITFLIGCIVAQQGIFQFRYFGAEIYVVDMVGVLTLRELGVLIVAIMIAGRTGSAYTAELGSMKMREEVDAVRVMGLSPIELLIMPRILAMVIGLPLLTIIGDFSALTGGLLVAKIYGDINFVTFLDRFQEVVSVRHLWIGLVKAPFMALVIGLIACVEGLRVQGSAESLGQQTTTSVVKSIFMVIVLDGIFAMFFATMEW